jgi:hypothetical protein
MKEWLAEELKRSLKESQVGRAHRSAVINAFNAKYKSEGVQITVGRLSRLYINAGGGVKGFIRSTLAAKRKAEKAAARASTQVQPSPQREQRKEESVPAIPALAKKAKAMPKPAPAKPRPAPAAPMRHPDLIAARAIRTTEGVPETWASARRLGYKEITPEMNGVIVDALIDWAADRKTQLSFKSPIAFAAARVNARRTAKSDPILNANAIMNMVDSREGLREWLLDQPAFVEKQFSAPARRADEIADLVPAF